MKALRILEERILGPRVAYRPPERVMRTIAQQQRRSEELIAIVQFTIICILILLYVLAPRPKDSGMMTDMIFKVIVVYGIYSFARLVLALRGFTPSWFLGLTGIADVALLMLLIYAIHVDYQQPHGFYLKSPTLLYVFIFIALRALRFDVKYLLLTGLAAALGWGLLVSLAVHAGEPGSEVTRSYVEYMTSNRILRGAEFDKIITMLITTGILALAVVRARRTLIHAAVEGEAARDLKRFFAPEIAQAITGSESQVRPGQGEVRSAAILHVDIRGFTLLSRELAPGELMLLLADYQGRMVDVIRRNGGSVDKFLGDGILASFGAARPMPDFAAAALSASHQLRQAADDWNRERAASELPPVRIGVSVASGPVVFGAVGDATRLEYTVIGDAVNLAAKLDKQCKRENCIALATLETLNLAREQGYQPPAHVEELPSRLVEGVPAPLSLAVLER